MFWLIYPLVCSAERYGKDLEKVEGTEVVTAQLSPTSQFTLPVWSWANCVKQTDVETVRCR